MRIDVVGKHLEVTDAIREYALSKSEKLLKFFDGTQQITVVLEQAPKNAGFSAEIVVDVVKHDDFVARANAEDLYAAIDVAANKAGRQIKDFKDKLRLH